MLVVARFEAQASLARALGATVIGHEPALRVIEEAAAWSGGVLQPPTGSRWRTRAESTWSTTRSASARRSKSAPGWLEARGTIVKAGVHGPTFWEDTPLYFKELSLVGSNAFGFEEIDGVRQHGIAHYLDLVADGRVDLTGMLTHTFALDDWRNAFVALATQDQSGAIKVAFDQRSEA